MIAAMRRATPLMSGGAVDEDAADEDAADEDSADEDSGAATVDSGAVTVVVEAGWGASTSSAHSSRG